MTTRASCSGKPPAKVGDPGVRNMSTYRALRVDQRDGRVIAGLERLATISPAEGEVLIRSHYSSVNYKDALAVTGRGKILRRFPLVAGVDVSGVIEHSEHPRFAAGDAVLVTGCGLGESRDGGFAEYACVPGDWVVPLPRGLTLREAMVLGTAGFTAALSIDRLEQNGLHPDQGPVLVTGASGGVGSVAIDLLSGAGYRVTALSRNAAAGDYLRSLGTSEVIAGLDLQDSPGPLGPARWAAAIDSVGGDLLADVVRTTMPWGSVASIGLAGAAGLSLTVMPFILRGVSILGITSANCPMTRRLVIWNRLVTDLRPRHLAHVVAGEVGLDSLPEVCTAVLDAPHRGRYIVNLLQ